MKFQKAAVIGAGAMGSGIAQVLSQAGLEVILKDVKQELVDRGLANIKRMYDSRVKKEVLTQAEADYLFAMVKGSTTYDGFKEVDLVIEAALEEIDVKIKIFQDLDKACGPHTIFATNTSALSVSEIASHTKRAEQVLGMHFFNPAQTMKLVEVIPGVKTNKQVQESVLAFCKELHKIPVAIEECPGFLVNRILFPYLNEALHVLEEGQFSPEEIDKQAVSFGFPMGPFTLLDMTGLDVCQHVTKFLYKEYGPRFEPSKILTALTDKGHLGQKTGAGFYMHPKGQVPKKDEPKQINPALADLLKEIGKTNVANKAQSFDALRIVLPMFNEALFSIQEKVVDWQDVDIAVQWGLGLNRGLLSLAEEKSLKWCLAELESYQKTHGERFRSSWHLAKLVRANIHDFSQLKTNPVLVR